MKPTPTRRRRETRVNHASNQPALRIRPVEIFALTSVTRIANRANLSLTSQTKSKLHQDLNAVAMLFHLERDEQTEPTGKVLAANLLEISIRAQSLAHSLGAPASTFPNITTLQKHSDAAETVWESLLKWDNPNNEIQFISPGHLLRALDLPLRTRPGTLRHPIANELPLLALDLVTGLAHFAAYARIHILKQLDEDEPISKEERSKSWVSFAMRLIGIYEHFGKPAGFSRSEAGTFSGPFFRFMSDAVEHVCANVPSEFRNRENLNANAPHGEGIADLIRTAKRRIKQAQAKA